jgi:hypothetical protein
MNKLRILLVCEEEAKSTRQKGTSNEARWVFEEEIIAREGIEAQASLPFEVRGELRVPRRQCTRSWRRITRCAGRGRE